MGDHRQGLFAPLTPRFQLLEKGQDAPLTHPEMECVLVRALADQEVRDVFGGTLLGLDVKKDMYGRHVGFFQGGHLHETPMRGDLHILLTTMTIGVPTFMFADLLRFGEVETTV